MYGTHTHLLRTLNPYSLGPGQRLTVTPPPPPPFSHALQVRLGLAGPTDLSVLSEWSVCREMVWQLLSPADSSLLQNRDGEFRPTGRFRVHGLTQVRAGQGWAERQDGSGSTDSHRSDQVRHMGRFRVHGLTQAMSGQAHWTIQGIQTDTGQVT